MPATSSRSRNGNSAHPSGAIMVEPLVKWSLGSDSWVPLLRRFRLLPACGEGPFSAIIFGPIALSVGVPLFVGMGWMLVAQEMRQ